MPTRRLIWATYITSHPLLPKLLSTRGDVEFQDTASEDETAVEDFLNRLTVRDRDRDYLCALRYLTRPKLQLFCTGPLKKLMRTVSTLTITDRSVTRGAVKGKVFWPQTFQQRLTKKVQPDSYVASIRTRSADNPENRLLKHFLTKMSALLRRIVAPKDSGHLPRLLISLKEEIDTLLRQSWLREVTPCQRSTVVMRTRARRLKDWRYGRIAFYVEEYEQIFLGPKWSATLTLLRRGWLEPIKDDDLFELYVLFLLFDILANDLGFGFPASLGLIRTGRGEVATFFRDSDGTQADIWFDQSPKEIVDVPSEYVMVAAAYHGLVVSPRRPDITLRFTCADCSHRSLLIECKDTGDEGYKRDSLYKCFGYLYDFRQLWVDSQCPKVLLVFPESIQPRVIPSLNMDVALVSADDRKRIGEALVACL